MVWSVIVGLCVGYWLTASSYPRPQLPITEPGFADAERLRLDVATHQIALAAYGRTFAQRALAFCFWSWVGWGVSSFVIAMALR